ncbi:MAG: response regulator [candidate division Zixibacteria bacterium]
MRNSKPILLVEDDTVDVMTVKRALKDVQVTSELVAAGDGEQALAYLRDDGNAKPCVILLDLNMPKMNGIEFMRIIKADEVLQRIPIIVLTTSNSDQDISKSFELGAAGYMLKSVDYKKFMQIIKTIDLYWTLSKLPLN